MNPNAARLTKHSPERDKLIVLGRKLKKADDVARLLKQPASGTVRAAIKKAQKDVDYWYTSPEPWE
jgi:hypothetical protein